MRYEDFTILFVAAGEAGYTVRVLDSPAGQGMCRFDIPVVSKRWFEGSSKVYRNLGVLPKEETVGIEELGTTLFDSLFREEVAQLLYQSLGHVAAIPECGLRIKLRLDPREPGLAGIYQLPWEYLRRKDTRAFLALDRRTSIVRYLDVPQPAVAMPLPDTLRVLVVLPSPKSFPPLDLNREQSVIEAAFRRTHHKFEVNFLRGATPGALRHSLSERPYHILHFSGHGVISTEGQASLLFENDDGGPVFLDSSSLAALLTTTPSLRLVLVNACNTAAISERNVFSGIATSLVLCGIPAVIANHSPISDNAACAFSESFYGVVARSASLDEAVAEGRMAIRQVESSSWEWGTPSLFSRLPANELFVNGGSPISVGSALRSAAYKIMTTTKEVGAGKASQEEPSEQVIPAMPDAKLQVSQYTSAFNPVRDSIRFVLRELEAGHQQARAEAEKWSRASLVAAGLGLSLVVLTVVMLVIGRTDAGVISSISSLVPTVISALFFSQSKGANRRMDSSLRQLSSVRDVNFAAEIAATIESVEECNRLKALIVQRLLGSGESSQT